MSNISLLMEQENAIDKRSCHGFHFYNIRDLALDNCRMTWGEQKPEPTWQQAFNFEQIENLSLDQIKAKAAPGQKTAIQFSEITGSLPEGYILNPQ